MEKRLDWLDSAKAFGMLLVFTVHCHISGGPGKYITMFFMPYFFIISGFLWNEEKNAKMTCRDFCEKKFRSYIIPYFKIAFVCMLIFGFLEGIAKYGLSSDLGIRLLKFVFGIFIYSRGTVEWLPNCSPIWFLTCLFFAEIFFYFLMRERISWPYVIVCGCIGFLMSLMGKVFPWNIDNALTAIPLIYVGVLLKRYWHRMNSTSVLILMCILSSAVFISGSKGKVDFDGNCFDNVCMMYVQSSIITITILLVFNRVFNRVGVGVLYGRNTLMLMGYNYAINSVVRQIPGCRNTWMMLVLAILGGMMLVQIAERHKVFHKFIV